jgi:hypothetical protein
VGFFQDSDVRDTRLAQLDGHEDAGHTGADYRNRWVSRAVCLHVVLR